MIKIKPVTVFPNTAEYAEFSDALVKYGKNASATCFLRNADGVVVGTLNAAMTEKQYALWGDNDDYAIECFLTNLGLEKA